MTLDDVPPLDASLAALSDATLLEEFERSRTHSGCDMFGALQRRERDAILRVLSSRGISVPADPAAHSC